MNAFYLCWFAVATAWISAQEPSPQEQKDQAIIKSMNAELDILLGRVYEVLGGEKHFPDMHHRPCEIPDVIVVTILKVEAEQYPEDWKSERYSYATLKLHDVIVPSKSRSGKARDGKCYTVEGTPGDSIPKKYWQVPDAERPKDIIMMQLDSRISKVFTANVGKTVFLITHCGYKPWLGEIARAHSDHGKQADDYNDQTRKQLPKVGADKDAYLNRAQTICYSVASKIDLRLPWATLRAKFDSLSAEEFIRMLELAGLERFSRIVRGELTYRREHGSKESGFGGVVATNCTLDEMNFERWKEVIDKLDANEKEDAEKLAEMTRWVPIWSEFNIAEKLCKAGDKRGLNSLIALLDASIEHMQLWERYSAVHKAVYKFDLPRHENDGYPGAYWSIMLRSLLTFTDRDFQNTLDWRKWYEANERNLVFDTEKRKFVVKPAAPKDASPPAPAPDAPPAPKNSVRPEKTPAAPGDGR